MYDLKKQVYIDKIAYTKGPLMSIFVWFFLFEMFFIIHFFTLRHKFFLHSLNKAPICSPFINKEYFPRIFLLPDSHRASFLMVSSRKIRRILQVGKMLLVQLYSRHLKTLPCPSDTSRSIRIQRRTFHSEFLFWCAYQLWVTSPAVEPVCQLSSRLKPASRQVNTDTLTEEY